MERKGVDRLFQFYSKGLKIRNILIRKDGRRNWLIFGSSFNLGFI